MTALHEVALLRLVAQRIAGPGFDSASDAVRWMTAVQAQDHSGAITSVALRTSSRNRQAAEDALDAGEVVKSWAMRGTLHLVVADDLPWMLDLLAPRVVAGASTRRARLDLHTADLEHARELAVEALVGGGRLMREELLAVWDRAGLTTAGQRGYHMLWHLAQTGSLCFGPLSNGQQQIVLVDEWIPRPRRLERQEALGELALRYFRSHGPATVKDLMRWAHLVAADARTGLALARPQLGSLDVEGVEHFMDPGTPDLLESCGREARGVVLLPGFDEFVLGYQDRRCSLPSEFADRIVPGCNGVFKAPVVCDGEIVGTWKHAGRAAKRTVEATPFASFADDVAEGIAQAYAALP